MELDSYYEISRIVDFILTHNFSRVAFQFPDDQLKDSAQVVNAVREKLGDKKREIGLYVIVDEVAASHINADSIIHFGHTCLSPKSNLPAFLVFGKATINVSDCAKALCKYACTTAKSILVLFGLEYAHAINDIKQAKILESKSNSDVSFADVMPTVVNPSNGNLGLAGSSTCSTDSCARKANCTENKIGGLKWCIPEGRSLDDYSLFWIGPDNSAYENVVLTFNACEIVRYDARDNRLLTDFHQQRRILTRRDSNTSQDSSSSSDFSNFCNEMDEWEERVRQQNQRVDRIIEDVLISAVLRNRGFNDGVVNGDEDTETDSD